MNQIIRRTGILALSTGTFLYLHHIRWGQSRIMAKHKEDEKQISKGGSPAEGCTTVHQRDNKDDPLVLRLVQVQVMFRHGARTPIYTMPNVPEVEYEPQFLSLDHQASMFPYQRVSCVDGSQSEYSAYEKSLARRLLRGGASAGSLTGLGREQTYLLGQRLKNSYKRSLEISAFNPKEIRIISSNVRRTVESAQGVLAGFYGKDQLTEYANQHGPVQIQISDPDYNILIPNTQGCEVLKKNNHSSMIHPDFLQGFKDQRLEVEEHIMKPRQRLLDGVRHVQSKIDSMPQNKGTRTLELNMHRQHYLRDPVMDPLFEERGQAIANVDRFWANVLNREPTLREIITSTDMKALIYLRNMVVEQFEGTLASGYRIHFYFDKNPYFYNSHLCKEVFTKVNPVAPPSTQTEIKWKPGRNLLAEESNSARNDSSAAEGEDGDIGARPTPTSFLQWFIQPTHPDSDTVGTAISGDAWRNPLSFSKNEPKETDHWERSLNFVFGRDDTVARVTHGLPYPPEVRQFKQRIDQNASSILYYSLAGQTPQIRGVVTRLSAGPLLTEMFDQACKLVSGQEGLKLCLYSSHDSTLSCLMESLGIWDNEWPPFASDLRLELYREVNKGDFYVRIIYNGKEQIIRGQTESFVRWDEFHKSVKNYLIRKEEMAAVCSSDILERIAEEVMRHEKGEVETEEIKEESETPAGM